MSRDITLWLYCRKSRLPSSAALLKRLAVARCRLHFRPGDDEVDLVDAPLFR